MEPQNTNQNPLEQQPPTPLPASPPPPPPQPAAPSQTPPVNQTPQLAPSKPQLTDRAEKLKKISIQVMIGSLIAAAALAVVSVLVGSFGEVFQKALFTLLVVMIHSLACLAFVEQTGKPGKSNFKFFEDSVFFIIVLSFFTSIFGVWGLISIDIVGKLYGTYFVLLFACLHGQMLVQTRGKQSNIDNIVMVNYVMMGLVILLLLPLIWVGGDNFPDFYYRLLAACGIIDATLTILAVILHRLYVQKHPEAQSNIFGKVVTAADGSQTVQVVQQKRRIHPLIWVLGIYVVGQLVVSVLFAVLGAL